MSILRIEYTIAALAILGMLSACSPGQEQAEATPAENPQMTQDSQQAETQTTAAIDDWSEASQQAYEHMNTEYGEPDAVTDEMAVWHHEDGPWERTEITAEGSDHNFPMPHTDVMQQYVHYEVPLDKVEEVLEYDGSVIISRTAGELSARCDMEGANFLALNLAHELIEDELSVEEARMRYGEEIQAMKAGEPTEYTQELLFEPMSPDEAGSPDEALPEMVGERE